MAIAIECLLHDGCEGSVEHGLGNFSTDSKYEDLSTFRGKRFAIDISINMNQVLVTSIDRLACTCNPPYKCPDLLQNIISQHNQYVREGIIPVYVFDGMPPWVKNKEKERHQKVAAKSGAKYMELRDRAKANPHQMFTTEELTKAADACMKMKHPTALDHANILAWIKQEGIEVYGALFEADQQMVQLEKDGIVDGIISEDGDEVILGAKLLFVRKKHEHGKLKYKVFQRDEFLSLAKPYHSKLAAYPELMPDAALLLGNDYMTRVGGNGEATVLGSHINTNDQYIPCLNDGMLNALAAAEDRVEYINTLGKHGKEKLSTKQSKRYWECRKYMLHAPVIRKCKQSNEIFVVPLNDLPESNAAVDTYFREECKMGSLLDDKTIIRKIYQCEILPLGRKPLVQYNNPFCNGLQRQYNPTAWFHELDFDADPIEIQPLLCLINWLRARGVNAHPTRHTRLYLENCVRNCLRVDCPISDEPLKPLAGAFNGFDHIRLRSCGDEYDTWNGNYVLVAKKLQRITDPLLHSLLGIRADCPSLQERVKCLVESGNYGLQSIQCHNVESTIEGSEGAPCILFCIDCLSSKKKVIHQVYAVFEDKPGGKYLVDHSCCSSKKGSYFCLHLVGFLHMMSIMQQLVDDQEEFHNTYPTNPHLLHSQPLLIKFLHVPEKFKCEQSQRKRRQRGAQQNN